MIKEYLEVLNILIVMPVQICVAFFLGGIVGFRICWKYFIRYHLASKRLEIEQKEKEAEAYRIKTIEASMEFVAAPGYFRSRKDPTKLFCPTCWHNKKIQVELSHRTLPNGGVTYICSSCAKP